MTRHSETTEQVNNTKPFTGMVSKEGGELDSTIEWESIKIWKLNLIQKLLIKLRIIKDPRYDGKKTNSHLLDEVGMW